MPSIVCVWEETSFRRQRGWTFSNMISMYREIWCNQAPSNTSDGPKPFAPCECTPSCTHNGHQFKCKSWHSCHSASPRLLFQLLKHLSPDLSELLSSAPNGTSHFVRLEALMCKRYDVTNNNREREAVQWCVVDISSSRCTFKSPLQSKVK